MEKSNELVSFINSQSSEKPKYVHKNENINKLENIKSDNAKQNWNVCPADAEDSHKNKIARGTLLSNANNHNGEIFLSNAYNRDVKNDTNEEKNLGLKNLNKFEKNNRNQFINKKGIVIDAIAKIVFAVINYLRIICSKRLNRQKRVQFDAKSSKNSPTKSRLEEIDGNNKTKDMKYIINTFILVVFLSYNPICWFFAAAPSGNFRDFAYFFKFTCEFAF
jgi:hypothetical protein